MPDWTAVTSPAARDAVLAILEAFDFERAFGAFLPVEDAVRTALLLCYAEQGRAPAFGELAQRTDLSEQAVRSIVAVLAKRDLVVLDADGGRIIGAYPFTERETDHRVVLGDRTIHSMCAIDALGVGAMLDRDVTVHSCCRACGVPVNVTTGGCGLAIANLEPVSAVVWAGIRSTDGCAASSLCTVIAFFCSGAHLETWRRAQQPMSGGSCLSIGEALEAGRAIFAPTLAIGSGQFANR